MYWHNEFCRDRNVNEDKTKINWNAKQKSIEINEKKDQSIKPQKSITEHPTQIESGKIFYLDCLTFFSESHGLFFFWLII